LSWAAHCLVALADSAEGVQRAQILNEAAQAARGSLRHACTLTEVSSRLAGEQRSQGLAEALNAACAIGDESDRAYVLAEVAQRLAGEPDLLLDALDATCDIANRSAYAYALVAVVRQLAREAPLWSPRPDMSGAADPSEDRPDSSSTLADWQAPPRGYPLFAWILDAASDLPRAPLLSLVKALAPAIAALGGAEAMQEADDAIRDTARWWR
jgi:hypothetical protein